MDVNKDGIYGEYDYKAFFCKCGCHNGIIMKAEKDDDDFGLSITLVSDNFYMRQAGVFRIIKEKIKRIWYILRNKEYCYFDICMNANDLKEFKEFVEKL